MKRILAVIGFLSALISVSGISFSSEETIPDTIRIDAVSITRQPLLADIAINRTEIDSLAMKEHRNHSLSALLSEQTPVHIKSYGRGAISTASFRGTSASHTLVEWNGIPINNPMLGQTDLSLIPLYFIDEVSLLHGASSMLYFTGALGGGILLNNVPHWQDRFRGSVIQTAGSYGTWQTYGSMGGGGSKLQFRIRMAHEQSENNFKYLNNANGDWDYRRLENAGYHLNGMTGEVNYRKNNHVLSGTVWLQGAFRDLPPIMSYEGSGREENQEDTHTRASVRWNYFGSRFKSNFFSGYSRTGMEYFLANNTDGGYLENYNSHSTTSSFINKYLAEFMLSPYTSLRGIIHFNHHRAMIDDLTTRTGFDAERTETGIGLSIHHVFSKHFAAYTLLEGEANDLRLSPVMPSLGLEIAPLKNDDLRLKLNVGRNYHLPTLNDLYWIPGGNPDLKPEEGYAADLTIEYTRSIDSVLIIKTLISGYINRVNDWIIWQPGEFRYWQAENISKVFARGIESGFTADLRTGQSRIRFTGNYVFTRTTNETEEIINSGQDNKQLIYIPVHAGSSMLHASLKNFNTSYGIQYTGERFTTSSNEETRHSLPGYTLHRISAGRTFVFTRVSGEVSLSIDNLFNRDYQAVLWRAMPGRNFTLLIKISF